MEQSRRKKWIRRAAGIFLFVLVLLTFFSNTIMNATLPQVTMQQIQSGVIQEQVRGSGFVKAEESHEIIAENTQIVQEKRKQTGDTVEQGEVLFVVQSEQEVDLKQQKEELEQLEIDYIKLVVESGISSEEKKRLEEFGLSEAECMAQMEAAKAEEKDTIQAKLLKQLDIVKQWRTITRKRETIKELEENTKGMELVAPVSGILQQVTAEVGETVQAGESMAVILQEGEVMEVSFSVPASQAAEVKVGDTAVIVSPRYLQNITATLKTIVGQEITQLEERTQTSEDMRMLTFELNGEVTSGEMITLAIEQNQGSYDFVVPLSALQSDKDGNFLLSIQTKTSPLGNRYYTERIPVTVQASDDTQAAVSGALYGNEYVVITSNLPLEGGQQVRLME